AIEILGRRLPAGHPLRIQSANFRAGFLIQLGRLGEARKTLENFAATEAAGVEAKLGLLNGWVILADIERLEKQFVKSQELAQRVLADPAAGSDRRLEADARWARAYALAMQAKMEEAEAERTHALDMESALAQGAAFSGVFANAKYHICAGDATQ